MCWKCDHPEATTQEWLELIYEKVKQNGYVVQLVESDSRPFAYTIGLHERGLPELLVTGMPPQRANLVLNTVAHYLLKGGRPVPGEQMFIGGELLLDFVQVQNPIAHLKFALSICGSELRALQVVWRDNHGHVPWCAEFSNGGVRQPVFGIRVDPPERPPWLP
jgi:hypothetical protein